jgi:hypothetical protein
VNARLKENLDAEDVPDTGDHPLIQENFPDFSCPLLFQWVEKLLDGKIGTKGVRKIGTKGVRPQVSPSGVRLKVGLGKELDNGR